MSWLFSQALVAEYSADTCLDGEPFVPSSGQPTQQAYCSPDKMTEFSRLSRFGMTYRPLTAGRGEELLTSYLAASRARTSARRELVWVLQGGVEVASGVKWPASSVRFDPVSSSWKTAHCLWEEDLPSSSVILPRWGMTRNGFVYQHPTAERPISATASGLWPTPNVPNGGRAMSAEMALNGGYTPGGKKRQINLETAAKYWPTPLASDAESAGGIGCLARGKRGLALNTAVRLEFPTPGFNDFKSGKGYYHGEKRQTPQLRHISDGLLNPEWVEWLMGWPPAWTDLKPLEMAKFREWQRQHGGF